MACIIAALDLGPATDAVLETSIDLARAFSLPIVVVSAWEHQRPEKAEHAVGKANEEVGRAMRREQGLLSSHLTHLRSLKLDASLHRANGAADDVICAAAEKHAARYIVMGAKQPSALRHLVGSVPADVMRRATVPVVFAGSWQQLPALH
ncbi:MAG: universal stress protein [Planctomycetota bacterium]